MTTRVFGAIQAAGVQVRETVPPKPIQDGPLGFTLMVGTFRSGPTDVAQRLPSGLPQYRRIFGGLATYSQGPLAAEHFYAAGQGAGELAILRVTDGSEVKSSLKVYDRNAETSVRERVATTKLQAQLMDLDAHNGGRWAGRRCVQSGVVSLPGDLTTTSTVDLGFAMPVDKYVGATITFPTDDASFSGVVTANTAAGVVTIQGTWSAAVTAGASGQWLMVLENVHELTGSPEMLAIEIKDSSSDSEGKFSLQAWRDDGAVKAWSDVATDSAGQFYWHDMIDQDLNQWELAPVDNFAGDVGDPLQRPANWSGIPAPAGVTATTVSFQILRWTINPSVSVTGDAFFDTVDDIAWGSRPVPMTVVVTFTAATTFSVVATLDSGEVLQDLPSGSLTNEYDGGELVPKFTLRAGPNAMSAGDTLTIYARPLPADLADKGCLYFPAAAASEGDSRDAYRVISNDHDSITLAPSADVTGLAVPPVAPTQTSSTAGTYNLAGGETLIMDVDGTQFTLTQTLVGAATTTTALVAELNGLELTRAGAAADKLIEFGVSTDDKVTITSLQDFGELAVLTVDSAGTINTIIGFSAVSDTAVVGTAATIGRLQWRQELEGGYDGLAALANSDYQDAWDPIGSPINDLVAQNTGLMLCATPGVTAAAVQTSMMTWAHATNGLCVTEIPTTETTEAAAVAWHAANLAVGPTQDYHACLWPQAKIANPYGLGLLTCTALGVYLGTIARKAVEVSGYHLAPANTGWALSPILVGLTTDDRPLDNELLNGYGLIELRKRGPLIMPWGDRIVGNGGRAWLHKRMTISHVGRILLTNLDAFVFQANSPATRARLRGQLIKLGQPWDVAGWFRGGEGSTFADRFQVKADDSNNPISEQDAGNMHAALGFDVVDTAERVVLSIGPNGVTESS